MSSGNTTASSTLGDVITAAIANCTNSTLACSSGKDGDTTNVPIEAVAFLGAVLVFVFLLIIFFLYLNKSLCFADCGGFPCIDKVPQKDSFLDSDDEGENGIPQDASVVMDNLDGSGHAAPCSSTPNNGSGHAAPCSPTPNPCSSTSNNGGGENKPLPSRGPAGSAAVGFKIATTRDGQDGGKGSGEARAGF